MAAEPQLPLAPASGFWARETEALIFNAAERRAQAPSRFLVSFVLGAGAAAFISSPALQGWLWAWAVVNVAAQALELIVLWRFRTGAPTPGAGWTAAGLASITLVSLAYASGSLLLWNMPGVLGAAAAVLILGGCLVNVMMLSRGSSVAFAATGLPHALFMVSGPFLARPELAQDALRPAFCLAEGVFVFGVYIVWRHLERLRQQEAKARSLAETRRAEAEAATQAKTRYAAAVSHELRTPLTAILAAADALALRTRDAEDAEAGRTVGDAARMMRRLLDDLLDLAKIEAGRMDVASTAFSPRALLEDVRRFWAAEAAGLSLDLTLEGAAELPASVRGDPVRLRQVLNNLLSNAVKFTDTGVVRITAEGRTEGERCRLTVTVADTGCGISPRQLARLFTPFEQVHEVGGRPGTGLGLAISRELARLMGGDLTAASSPFGSQFTVWVNLGAASADDLDGASEPAARQLLPPAREREGIRLLVVDDQPLVRNAISVLLDQLGITPTFAVTGDEALERLAVQPFDLVLMDVNLADMDGRDVTRRLRGGGGPNRATPVIAVTGAADAASAQACLASGMSSVLAKPLEPRAFYAALDAALEPAVGSEAVVSAA